MSNLLERGSAIGKKVVTDFAVTLRSLDEPAFGTGAMTATIRQRTMEKM
jgi:hypothetical protein